MYRGAFHSLIPLILWYVLIYRVPGGSSGKEPICQCRSHRRCRFNPWVGKIHWRRAWQPTPVFLPGESHGQRSLVGSSSWGRKELDTTEAIERACTGSPCIICYNCMWIYISVPQTQILTTVYHTDWLKNYHFLRRPVTSQENTNRRINSSLGKCDHWPPASHNLANHKKREARF